MANDSDLVSRIARIEASLRMWRLLTLGVVVLGVAATTMLRNAVAAPEGDAKSEAIPDVLRAHEFVLVDAKGRERATLTMNDDALGGSYPSLLLRDADGPGMTLFTSSAVVLVGPPGYRAFLNATSLQVSNGKEGRDQECTTVSRTGIEVRGNGPERPSFSCGITNTGGVHLDLEAHDHGVKHSATLQVRGGADFLPPLTPEEERGLTAEGRREIAQVNAEERFKGSLFIGSDGARDGKPEHEGVNIDHSSVAGQGFIMYATTAGLIKLAQPKDGTGTFEMSSKEHGSVALDTSPSFTLGDAANPARIQIGAVTLDTLQTGAKTRYPAAIVLFKPDGHVLWMAPND